MRQFLTTLVVVWIAACIAAYVYSQQQNIPSRFALAVTPAFLVEFAFYLAPGFPAVRKAFDSAGSKVVRAAMLAASAVVPYLIESPLLDLFRLPAFLALLAAVLVAAFWYAAIPASMAPDLLFLGFMGAVYLSKLFDRVYGHPAAHVPLAILGQLMWIRVGLMAVLSLRSMEMEDVRFGFLPSRREWRVGVQFYAYFLPVAAAISYLLHFARFHPQPLEWWKFLLLAAGTFLAFLWVVALAEEFFFRAFLQRLLARGLHSETLGLILASVLFGLAHLPFRSFPNWRFAILGGVSGVFYGIAFLKAQSVRASMVTHALVVTTWRVFFAG
ncbi:MAG TPA: CPBP family intramembrane glutamic endopeptidase [Bryobacteraceae bacterium]|nr:CPBP family intramembrane glutamic endopeptidase [Bryobacteraceae bacterium]